uniref:Uncharacterized protein n=1 Tax=Mucochytrium quahogii TaxID=96639 RepID=A0A7S2RQP0_9STRA|mmetsp:Transcript_12662/g.20480  ORF Transcript_12662/g.20480 Transcript_12662/m.20480 type:complete len:696 (+) Transcript_12662:27-2114(+)
MANRHLLEQMELEQEKLRVELEKKENLLNSMREQVAMESKANGLGGSVNLLEAQVASAVADQNVEELTKSFQRLQSDNDMRNGANAVTRTGMGGEELSGGTESMSRLLRTASSLSKPGGKVPATYKALLKELVLHNDAGVKAAIELSAVDGGTHLRAYLKQVLLEQFSRQQAIQKDEFELQRQLIAEQQSGGAMGGASEKHKQKLERKMSRTMEKAAAMSKKMQRLGVTQSMAADLAALPQGARTDTLLSQFNSPGGGPGKPATADVQQLQSFLLQQQQLQQQYGGGATPDMFLGNAAKFRTATAPPPVPQLQMGRGEANPEGLNALQTFILQSQLQNNNSFGSEGLQSPYSLGGLNYGTSMQMPLNLGTTMNKPNSSAGSVSGTVHFNQLSGGDLGSKRSRPESMNRLTSFRDQNRSRMGASSRNLHGAVMPEDGTAAGGMSLELQMQLLAAGASALKGLGGGQNIQGLSNSTAPGAEGGTFGAPSVLNKTANGGASDAAVSRPKIPSIRPDIAINTREYIKSGKNSAAPRRWSEEEDALLRDAVIRHKEKNWKAIAEEVPGRNHVQCLQRWRKALDPAVVKGHWTPDEDTKLLLLVAENPKNWGHVAKGIPGRTAKQCRERYHNHLDPSIRKGGWTEEEDATIVKQQKLLGNKWAEISKFLPGRTENSVKIRWKSIQRHSVTGKNKKENTGEE